MDCHQTNKLNNFVFVTFVTSAKNYINSCFSYTLLYIIEV